MYSLKDMRKVATHFSQNPGDNFDEWIKNGLINNESDEAIQAVVDEWCKCDKLPKPRINSALKKAVSSAIGNFYLEEILEAIRNYSEVMNSDYDMTYIWDIRKFLSQKNAAPDFMNDGTKWLNFKQHQSTKFYRWSQLEPSHSKRKELIGRVADLISKFRKTAKVSVNGDLSPEALEEKRRLTINSMLAKYYPAIFATAAKEKNVILDSAIQIPTTIRSFRVYFEEVVEMLKDSDKPIAKYRFKEMFDSLKLE